MSRRVTNPRVSRNAYHAVSGRRLATGGWELRIGRTLNSPNRSTGRHWGEHHAERTAWEVALRDAMLLSTDLTVPGAYQSVMNPARVKRRMRLTLVREVPHVRNYLKDRDNLAFSSKRLTDAMKAVGLIYDDSMGWLETPQTEQRVSADGLAWTVIRVEPVEGAGAEALVRPGPARGRAHRGVRGGAGEDRGRHRADADSQRPGADSAGRVVHAHSQSGSVRVHSLTLAVSTQEPGRNEYQNRQAVDVLGEANPHHRRRR